MGKDLFNPHLRKFSIRKLSIGVCSVLLSTLLLLGATSQVNADETTAVSIQNTSNQTNATETSVSSNEAVTSTSEQAPKTESAVPATETEKSQTAENSVQKASESEKVEKTTDPTETKAAEESQATTVSKESTSPAVVVANSVATKESVQPSRSRRVRRDATSGGQTNNGIGIGSAGADDATSTPRVPKPSLDESIKKDSVQLARQISWLDFSDRASWENLDRNGGLKVGTTFKKEISPGYEVTLTVTELKPFNSTEIYKKRVEGTPSENTYNPNAENGYLKSAAKYGKTPPSVTGAAQNQWTTIRDQGFDTQNRKTQLVYPENSTNWGVKFKIEATYLGKRVAPTVVMADGEDANPGEFAMFTTNGTGWEYLGEWKKNSAAKEAYTVITKKMLDEENKKTPGGLVILRDKSVDWEKYLSPDTVTGGLGSQVFGPNLSHLRTVPVVMTRGASEVGFYVASSGQQAMMMGFLVVDGSDAPESYGKAFHTISARDSVTNATIKQPYLGTTPADIDVESANDWVTDDRKEIADEGATQLLADDQLTNSNDLLNLDKAKDGSYTIKVKASPNGNSKAHIKAWVDFNQNGIFEENEASDVKTITAAGDHTLTFKANPTISGGQVDKLGMRFRIATNEGDIEKPTGIAFSGEVEDMRLLRIHPPKGEKKTTDGFTGETQTANLHFTPKGTDRSDHTSNTTMSSQAPQVLDNQGNVLPSADGTSYIRPEGIYVVTTNGNDVKVSFTPNTAFSGTAEGINIRWKDSNGSSTNWQSTNAQDPNKNDILSNMDGRYIPTVRKIPSYDSNGLQGLEQSKNLIFNDDDSNVTPVSPDATRPATFVDASGQPVTNNTVPARSNGQQVGTYELEPNTGKVIFKPNKNFYGTPDPIVVQVSDTDGKAHRARYQPTVTKVTPTSTNAESTGLQGQPQSGKPTFTPGDQAVPIDLDTPMTFENGQATKTVQGVGEYKINSDGTITFTPEKQFVGTPDPVTVKRVDKNGTEVTATYKPTVTKVTPTGTGKKTSGLQGQVQTGKVSFTPGHASVPFPTGSTPLFDNGTTVKEVPNVGKFEVDADGNVTFTPNKQFKGETPELELTRVDANGTPVTVKYQAVVREVIPTGTDTSTTGKQGQVQTGTPTFTGGHSAVPMDNDTPATFDDGTKRKVVPQVGTFEVASDGTVTFTPEKQFVGTPDAVTVKRYDKNGTEVTATYKPTVTKVTPTGTGATSTGPQGVAQTGKPSFEGGDTLVPIDESIDPVFDDGTKTKIIPNQGTYTISSDGTVTFTPEKQFVGTPTPVTVKRVDKNGTEVTASYTPSFTKVTPTSTNAESTGLQGQPQSGKPTFTPGDQAVPIDLDSPMTFENGQATKTVQGVGEYKINSDGTITFTPEKQFVGTPDPVTVKRVDKNGTEVTATYKPTVTKVTPTGTGNKTSGLQGQVQTGKVSFTPGHASVPFPAGSTPLFDNGTTVKEVPNVGKFEADADGNVTFTPNKQFKGETPELELTRVDANGTPVTVKYQAVVREVVPTGTDTSTTGKQGQVQTGTPTFTEGHSAVPMDNDTPATFDDGTRRKVVPQVGTFEVALDGTVTFTPEKQFVGTPDAVTVKRYDKNGTPVTAKYTVKVEKVTPTSTNAESTGLQGQPQSGKPTFTPGDQAVPIDLDTPMTFENGQATKTVQGVGEYKINSDGTITFTPEKQFVGTPDPVTVKRVDKNGTEVTATYKPTVTKVTPTGTDATSTNIKGKVQTAKPIFEAGNPLVPIDSSVRPVFEDGTTEKTIPGEGTYTLSEDGTVTFTPDANFVGQATSVTVVRKDTNGTSVSATYTPTVVDTSISHDQSSSGRKGEAQNGKPTFEGSIDETVPPTFEDGTTTKTVPGQGTYTIAPDGTVTFTPDTNFVGTATGVIIKRLDIYGNEVKATYTPTVLGETTTENVISQGTRGEQQSGKPVFNGDVDTSVIPTFDDGTTEKIVDGEGKYTIAIDGTVTFTPEAHFVGEASGVTVIRKDRNGNTISATYKPKVVDRLAPVVPVVPVDPATPSKPKKPTKPLDYNESIKPTISDKTREHKEEISFINPKDKNAKLPNTGSKNNDLLGGQLLATLGSLLLLSLVKKDKKEE